MFPNENENADDDGVLLLVEAGAPDVDDVMVVASAILLTVDGMFPPVFPNENVDLGNAWFDAAGVVENGLLVPDPLPVFPNPLNGGFVGVLVNAEFIEPNGDPPLDMLVVFNLNLGGAADTTDDSAGADVEAEGLRALKSNVDVVGFDGSGAAAKLEETPDAGVGAGLLANPKLNLGTGTFMAGPLVVDRFWGVLEGSLDLSDSLVVFD